jgi:hypothetical protein
VSEPTHHTTGSGGPADLLGELLAGLADGLLTAPQAELLADLLRRSAEARRRYVLFINTHAMLCWEHAAPLVIVYTGAAKPTRRRATRPYGPTIRYAAAAAIVLAVIGFFATIFTLSSRPTESQDRAPVATLIDSTNAVWELSAPERGPGEGSSPRIGDQLPNSWLKLKSGTAKLEFFSGAQVTLTGPCEFGLNSPMRGFLKLGKLAAYCPKSAHGFTVAAPGCAVVDLGTRFGMDVDSRGTAEVRVIEGAVDLRFDKPGSPPLRMAAGEGGRVAAGEVVERFDASTGVQEPGVAVPSDYAQAVKAAKPIAYWRFNQPDAPRIANEMSRDYPARVQGDVTLGGSGADHGARFGSGAGLNMISVDEPLRGLATCNYTIELLAMTYGSDAAQMIFLWDGITGIVIGSPDEPPPAGGALRFAHRWPAGEVGGVNVYSQQKFTPRQWHHVVAIKSGPVLKLYVDGVLSGRASGAVDWSLKETPPTVLGVLHTPTNPVRRPFVGQLDEVAIYDRELSDSEIQQHYRWITPPHRSTAPLEQKEKK